MTWGGAALTSVAHTVSMLLNTSSDMLPEWLKVGSLGLCIWEAVWAVPRERERPTPSLVPTSNALIGSGELLLLSPVVAEGDADAASPPSFACVADELDVAGIMEGRRPDDALSRSTR
mmetsp:Transcript_15276/g.23971  ORF Transcript_15276/g.23971 Transcript_15276/m.23971 type:complete len:118 (-) Transcript_15276:20-373(-)